MKGLFVLWFVLSSVASFASEEKARDAFSKSFVVRRAIELSAGLGELGEVTAAFLAESCGVAGCGDTYLVSQAITPNGANPQTKAIIAIVSRDNPLQEYKVNLVDTQAVIDLGN